MNDRVNKGEELSDRFSTRSRPKDAPDEDDGQDPDGGGDDPGTDHTRETSDQDGPPEGVDTGEATRTRSQYAMYLPDGLQEELDGLYDQYNGQSLIDGEGGIEKHKDFLEGVIRAGLDHPELDSYVGVRREQ